MSITRTTLTDDDGSGTTGTPVNNAWLQAVWDTLDGRWSEATTTSTGNQDDFNYTEADVLRCNNATTITLRGLLAPASPLKPGKRLIIVSVGAGTVVLNDQDTNSTAANRLITGAGAPMTLAAGIGYAWLEYDSVTARWRVVGSSVGFVGTLPVSSGGTGAITLTGLVKGNGTSAMTAVTAPTGAVVGTSDTQTLSAKRLTPRVTSITSSATPTINTDTCDAVSITALGTAITSMTSSLSGTPVNFDKLIIRIKDDGTARAISWGASFAAKGVALPTTTVISKLLTVGFIYDSVAATWGCVASSQEA